MLSFEDEYATALPPRRAASFPDGGRTRSPGILAQAMTSSNPGRDVDADYRKRTGLPAPQQATFAPLLMRGK